MSDRHPTEMLSAYLDGEVTSEERLEVARHLDACEGCRALLDDFRTMAAAAAQEPPPPAPAGMVARIMAAIEAPARKPRRVLFPWIPMPVAVAAGLLVVVAGTWVLLHRQPGRQPVTVAQADRESGPAGPGSSGDLAGSRRDQAPPPAESESTKPDQPAAGAPPTAGDAQAGKDDRLALRAPGARELLRRIPAETAEVPPEAKAAPRPAGGAAKSVAAADESPDSAPAPGPAPSSPAPAPPAPAPGLPVTSVLQENSGTAAGAAAGGVAAYQPARQEAGGRSIVFEIEGAKGTLTEAGLVTLVLDQGTCSVDLSAAPAAGEEVRSIFRLATTAPIGAAAGEPPEKMARQPARRIRVYSPAARPHDAANAGQIEERLRRLLEVAARDLIESRCGPPPQSSPGE